jgi:hypothetical protein
LLFGWGPHRKEWGGNAAGNVNIGDKMAKSQTRSRSPPVLAVDEGAKKDGIAKKIWVK